MKLTLFLTVLFCLGSVVSHAKPVPEVQLPEKLNGSNVLVLYKKLSEQSRKTAFYYAVQRSIPLSQVVAVPILGKPNKINQRKFAAIYQQISPHLTAKIKVIVLAWHAPYRVDCMSITSAFTLGFAKKYCSHPTPEVTGCQHTANNHYFNSSSARLWQPDSKLRLTMMLSGETFQQAKQLIDRGVFADNSQPIGDAYLVRTHDPTRSIRWSTFKRFADIWGNRSGINVQYIDDSTNEKSTTIKNKRAILFYHTGLTHVPLIDSNAYLPGAIADHLTSGAGIGIGHRGQMKAFRWLEAGATASYGAVIEPCNFPEKFPNPQILIPAYRDGDTLIEAYWKSVQQPGEGLFIGEPLARPWDKTQVLFDQEQLVIRSTELDPKQSYKLEAQASDFSPWQAVKATIRKKNNSVEIRTKQSTAKRYRVTY